MGVAATLLLAANIVYATSYVVTRLVLDDVPPMTLALLRLVLGAAVLVPLARRGATAPIPRGLTPGQGARVFWMGALGFAAAFALSHWGIARSSATNAALLIVVEPLTLVVLGPLLLGERLTRRGRRRSSPCSRWSGRCSAPSSWARRSRASPRSAASSSSSASG